MTDQDKAAAPPADEMVVALEHKFFASFEDIYFRLTEQTQEPVAVVKLSGADAVLGFAGIRREFELTDDKTDGCMLSLVEKGLKYVKGLRVGDPIPREVLTGEASWDPQPHHREIAYHRLTLQMVTWLSGEETLITDPAQLQQIAEDPATKKKINDAFDGIADKLGIGRERRQEVIGLIENLSEELSYIEALRDQARKIPAMQQKVQILRRLFSQERSMLDVVDPVARLMTRAVKEFEEMFGQIDAQTGEILSVLKNFDSQIAYIRDARDDLHQRLMAWAEILDEWDGVTASRDFEDADLLRRTYRFLAPRFMQVSEWVLVTKPKKVEGAGRSWGGDRDNKKKSSSAMQW